MLKNKYEEITIEERDELGLIGIQIKMDRENKQVHLTQKKISKGYLLLLNRLKEHQPQH